MTGVRLFQTSFNRADWAEHPLDEEMRRNLKGTEKPEVLRSLFGFKARVIKDTGIYAYMKGHVFEYARPKLVPASFPLEALAVEQGQVRRLSYRSDEIELLPA